MAAQYSHKQFFRRVSHLQLSKYFQLNDVQLGVDFTQLKEKEVDHLFDAFTRLPPKQQAKIEAEFQDINALACEGGIVALCDEADFHEDEAFVEAIAAIEGFHAKAMLDYGE